MMAVVSAAWTNENNISEPTLKLDCAVWMEPCFQAKPSYMATLCCGCFMVESQLDIG